MSKTRWAVAVSLLVCGAVSVNAGEKIKFSRPSTNTTDFPFDFNRRSSKSFESSLTPSGTSSGDIGSIPFVPPAAAPASRYPNAKDNKKAREQDWIFMTSENAQEEEAENEDEYSPEKVLGIQDYLLSKPSSRDSVRNYVQQNNEEGKSLNKDKGFRDQNEEEGSDADAKERKADRERTDFKQADPFSLGAILHDKNAERPGNFETKSSFRTIFTAKDNEKSAEVEKEQKQQMSEFKGLLRPREGGSKILFDNLNPDAAPRNFGGDSAEKGAFGGLSRGGPAFNNPFAPRQTVAAAPVPSASAFQAPAPSAPLRGRSDNFAGGGGSFQAQPKPAVLPFPKRPGSL